MFAARIKSHAKSHIVQLTDGSIWRICEGRVPKPI